MRNDQVRQITVVLIAVVAVVALLLALVACSPRDVGTSAPVQQRGSSYADLVERGSPHVATV